MSNVKETRTEKEIKQQMRIIYNMLECSHPPGGAGTTNPYAGYNHSCGHCGLMLGIAKEEHTKSILKELARCERELKNKDG